MKKLNIAIVGIGHIGSRHAKHASKLGNLAAVCDIKHDRVKAFAEQYTCKSYFSLDELLAGEKFLDLIAICTPNGLHAEHSIKALKAGCNVLCEKPMAIKVRDCERMIHMAEETNRRLFIVKQNRFNPPVQAVKKVIEEGRLGRILNAQVNCFWNRNFEYYTKSDWRGKLLLDGGTLFTQYSHFIDLLYWFVGDVEKVRVFTENYIHKNVVEFEDTGVVALKFASGAVGTINFTINSFGRNMEGSITLFGEKGTVKIGGQYLNLLEYQSIEGYEIKGLEPGNPPNVYGKIIGSMSNHEKVYENVIDVLTRGGSIATDLLDGLKTVQIIEKIYKAAEKGYEQ
ncbi:oxidoreductase [Thermoplasmatales archaeon SM1-50]|nr:MAG: oxidoreductase [Thermoplasmatales archaeon SM1-50]